MLHSNNHKLMLILYSKILGSLNKIMFYFLIVTWLLVLY